MGADILNAVTGAPGAIFDDIEVKIEHTWGTFWISLQDWVATGPGLRPLIHPSAARSRSAGTDLPLTVVPLGYRNDAGSLLAILRGRVKEPWGRPRTAVARSCYWLLAGRLWIEPSFELRTAIRQRNAEETLTSLRALLNGYRDLLVSVSEFASQEAQAVERQIARLEALVHDRLVWKDVESFIEEHQAVWRENGPFGRLLEVDG